ncbi:MAG: 4'-phosphopantetheinyl transferase superfamily protein [Alistipes sp.]|nr:4'-phosphopantetheinyl transferase superfamily protein [Alistipes sp.]
MELRKSVSGSSGCAVHVAVSHCEDCIAVAFADTPCAVDVESASRDFGRVVSRCMSAEERILSDDPLWPAIVWCAKETLYKFAGRRELDLLRDLRIEEADFHSASLVGRICGGEALRLHFLLLGGRVIVFLS